MEMEHQVEVFLEKPLTDGRDRIGGPLNEWVRLEPEGIYFREGDAPRALLIPWHRIAEVTIPSDVLRGMKEGEQPAVLETR